MPDVLENTKIVEKTKAVDLSELNISQRGALREGLQDAMQNSAQFAVLGTEQKVIYYSTMSMMKDSKSILMLDLEGTDFWRKVAVPGEVKKENVRFLKFKFNYHIPGTCSSIQAEREWKYEDLR